MIFSYFHLVLLFISVKIVFGKFIKPEAVGFHLKQRVLSSSTHFVSFVLIGSTSISLSSQASQTSQISQMSQDSVGNVGSIGYSMGEDQVDDKKATKPCFQKTYLVTGSTDGIGRHTAMRIAENGGNVILHGKNPIKLSATHNLLRNTYPKVSFTSYCYDLSTIQGAKDLARVILKDFPTLNGLINNAGIYTSTYEINKDGVESTFAVNVVAPFILSILLLPLLKQNQQSKILNVSSTSQEEGNPRIDISNLQFQHGGFSDHASYSLSKLCMAAMSHEFAKRVHPEDALVISCDPGDVDTQMLRTGWPGYQGMKIEDANDEFKLISARFDPKMHGKYYVNCRESRCNRDVYDDKKRLELWRELERITGIHFP